MLSTTLEVQSRHLASALLHFIKEILAPGLSQPDSLNWATSGARVNGKNCSQHESSQTVVNRTKDGDEQMQEGLVWAMWRNTDRIQIVPIMGNQPAEGTLNTGRGIEQLDCTKRSICFIYRLIGAMHSTLLVAGTGVACAIKAWRVSLVIKDTMHNDYAVSAILFILILFWNTAGSQLFRRGDTSG